MSAVVNLPNFRLRQMAYRDLGAVVAIEASAYHFPWSKTIFRDCLRVGYSCWVYEEQDVIQAYGIMTVAVGECHILNLCVKPTEHGRGLGRILLRRLLSMARRNEADTAVLEVRPSNHKAIKLYLSEGFNEVGRRKSYYPAHGGREDAMIMAKAL